MTVTLYHNPKCSKSRQTLALLEEQGIEPQVVLYLEQPLSASKLKHLCTLLAVSPQEIIRFKETVAKEAGFKKSDDRTQADWLSILAENPILMERPIVVVGSGAGDQEKAAIGRPPENILSILE